MWGNLFQFFDVCHRTGALLGLKVNIADGYVAGTEAKYENQVFNLFSYLFNKFFVLYDHSEREK